MTVTCIKLIMCYFAHGVDSIMQYILSWDHFVLT